MGLGDVKDAISLLFKFKRARDQFYKEKYPMAALLNLLKHTAYVALGTIVTALVTFLSTDSSIVDVLTRGGLPAVYITIALPLFHLAATAIENFVKHLNQS